MAKNCLLVATIVLSACADRADHHGSNASIDASTDASADASLPPGTFQCPAGTPSTIACSDTTQYCYAGAELQFYGGPGTIQLGCNDVPAGGTLSCDYLMTLFAYGYCTCEDAGGGPVIRCSFI
jgi:hypothetical protein